MSIKYLIRWINLMLLIVASNSVYGQETLSSMERELAFHADVMTNATEPEHRLRAMEQFNTLFIQAIAMQGAYSYGFDKVKWISRKMPADKSFKLYTWEVDAGDGGFRYFGVIQSQSGQIFNLKDHFKAAESLVDEEFDADQWLGAVYYELMEGITDKGQKYYLLFGVNRWNAYENIKLIDVLFFTDEGQPYFGLPVFRIKNAGASDSYLNRLVFKYASDARMTVNYNPGMQMIMVDNLIRKMSRIPGQGETMVPDGTYVGYELKNGYWQRIDQIAVTPMDTAPRPKPILDSRKNRDIQGKQRAVKNK